MQNPVEQGILAFQIEGELVVDAGAATRVKACTLGPAGYTYHKAMDGWAVELGGGSLRRDSAVGRDAGLVRPRSYISRKQELRRPE